MDLPDLEAFLKSPSPHLRLKAITELHDFEPNVVVPLLKQQMQDQSFIVRSFVAKELGRHQNDEAYEILLHIVNQENDYNVVAEAANSLSKFGSKAVPHLKNVFEQKPHWLVRLSIFAVVDDAEHSEVILHISRLGFEGEDPAVKLAAIAKLGQLKETPHSLEAIALASQAAADSNPLVREKAARVLSYFGGPQATDILETLRQDSDYRVVKAVLEGLL